MTPRPFLSLSLRALLVASCTGAIACGEPGLGREEVTNLPAGDGTGDAFSGLYAIRVRTTNCQGACAVDSDWGTISLCDIGDTAERWVEIEQTDGRLEASWAEPLSLLRGGISQDGSFDIGGFGTQGGSQVEISLRVTGRIGDAALTAEARSWTVGSVAGGAVDCVGTYEVTAPRPSPGTPSGGPRCGSDDECENGNCNFELDQCLDPGPDGTPCGGDDDCLGGNCNFETDLCQAPAPDGTPCGGDDDCLGGNCNFETDLCQAPGPDGSPCGGDDDCIGGSCNFDTDVCGPKDMAD